MSSLGHTAQNSIIDTILCVSCSTRRLAWCNQRAGTRSRATRGHICVRNTWGPLLLGSFSRTYGALRVQNESTETCPREHASDLIWKPCCIRSRSRDGARGCSVHNQDWSCSRCKSSQWGVVHNGNSGVYLVM